MLERCMSEAGRGETEAVVSIAPRQKTSLLHQW